MHEGNTGKKSVAIIGTGIAGLGCAFYLRKHYRLSLYEKNDYFGGHTNTVTVSEGDRDIPVDTGFMVYNKITYPNLVRLFKELKVDTQETDMSFSVQHRPTGFEYCGSGLDGLLAQRSNLLRPAFWKMMRDILRFNRTALDIVEHPRNRGITLGQLLDQFNFSQAFADMYLLPMSAAIWSTPHVMMREFPAASLVKFFHNHGLLGVTTQYQWRTVSGGSKQYRDKLLSHVQCEKFCERPARNIIRHEHGATVVDKFGERKTYDHVIIATHADEALQLLENPTEQERDLLAPFIYKKNEVLLHTDPSPMPRSRKAWASWNYRYDPAQTRNASTIYWMNRLQNVSDRKDYFVSVDDPGIVNPEKILRRFMYTHPMFTNAAIDAQAHLPELNQDGRILYCGSYFRNGFHEDALVSALNVVNRLTGNSLYVVNHELATA